jgi:hypothetical protein
MKKITLKSLVSTMALAALILTPASLSAQQELSAQHGASLEGAWDSQVTSTDCNGHTLLAFRSFELFHQGGTFTATGNAPNPEPNPGAGSPVLGTWQRTGMRTFTSPIQFFTFNPDGSAAGTVKLERQIHLSADGNSYTATSTFAVYDLDGNLVFSGCGTDVGTRLP